MSEEEDVPNWFCPFQIPAPLFGHIHPLVFLMGLDISVHRGVWESLNLQNLTKTFKPVYKIVPLTYKFPTKKLAKQNELVECYMPHGILKSNWTTKHLNEIPSSIIIFFDLNWTSSQWQEKKTECAQRIKSIKAEVQAHGTQLLVMLIKIAGVGEEMNGEKISSFCAEAGILTRHLFVLPPVHLERIQTCLQRLEHESESYYKARIKKITSYKEKATQTPLLVRYNFKIGFFHELRSDYELATSHYQAANDALLNIKMTEANVQELKVVASIVNYRICRLHLITTNLNKSKDQFDRHIRSFYKLEGNKDLIFEHLAWIEQQYHLYGELLKHNFRFGINYPDPVAYFLMASKYAEKRKRYFHERIQPKGKLEWPVEMMAFKSNLELQFLGQRPWRTDSFSLENVYVVEDPRVISMLVYLESITKHSVSVINHLGVASDFCKETKRKRTRCQLMNSMGLEFLASKDFKNCILLMNHVLREMSYKKWNKIILNVAECGLRAACCEGDIPSYLNFLIILLKTDISEEERTTRNLWSKFQAIMEQRMPLVEDGCEIKIENWNESLSKPFTAYVECHDHCILDFNVFFVNEAVTHTQSADVRFELKNRSQHVISIRKYGILRMNIPEYNNIEAIVDLQLQPGESTALELQLKPFPRDVGKILQIQVAFVDIGREDRSVILHNSLVLSNNFSTWLETRKKEKNRQRQISLRVEPPKPFVEVKVRRDMTQALVNEWYRVVVKWENKDEFDCTKLLCSYMLSGTDIQRLVLTADPKTKNFPGIHSYINKIDKLAASGSIETVLYVKTLNPTESELKLVIEGKYFDSHSQALMLKTEETIDVLGPFDVSQSTTNLLAEKIDYICIGDEFCLVFTIQNISKTPLILIDAVLNVKSPLFKLKSVQQKQLDSTVVQNGESVEVLFFLTATATESNSLGYLEITWERVEKREGGFTTTTTEIPVIPLSTHFSSLSLHGVFSNNGRGKLKQPLMANYTIHNRSPNVHDLTISMESNESFMNAGPKKVTMKLKSKEEVEFSYLLFPLQTGSVTVPKLNIESSQGTDGASKITSNLDTSDIPKTIFVTP